jgi:bacterioferritin-associated ferredoxin
MKTHQKQIALLLALVTLLQPVSIRAFDDKPTPWLQSKIFGRRPKTPETNVQKLARAMDWLEEELLEDGSVVAKAPDVWGEARLTAHRAEFEKQMAAQVGEFKLRVNASVSRSDQAFLASALALNNSATTGSNGSTSPFTQINQMLPGIAPVTPAADGTAQTQPTSGTMTVFNSPPGQLFGTTSPFGTDYNTVQLEQTIELDQRARYLNHLHELRRLNEGDDTADSPGYSLNLVRIPISILPGSKTRRGHSAEITVTAEPVITDQLLPSTFRALVINDLVDQLTVPVVAARKQALERERILKALYGALKGVANTAVKTQVPTTIPEELKDLRWFTYEGFAGIVDGLEAEYTPEQIREQIRKIQHEISEIVSKDDVGEQCKCVENLLEFLQPVLEQFARVFPEQAARIGGALIGRGQANASTPLALINDGLGSFAVRDKSNTVRDLLKACTNNPLSNDILIHSGEVINLASELNSSRFNGLASVSGHRRARSPLSGEALQSALGGDLGMLVAAANRFAPAGSQSVASAIRNLFRDELENAYETIFDPDHLSQLDLAKIEQSLATGTGIETERRCFSGIRDNWGIDGDLRKLLCWPILVESLLLNRQLNADIRHVSQDPECQCLTTGADLIFYGLDPDPTARLAFVQYVKCRWPVHVFALDPVAQEQNVTDQYAMRREMQLAMALALSQGRIGAQTATRYARRLEMDMETVALNRTAVAFGHGRDTFGWRFSPRVQTPEFESNGKVLFRDMLLGGPNRDDLKKQWQLEPGMRECYAVVLMPSFITHVRFDSRGHFSPLVCDHLGAKTPADTRSSMTDTVELSRMIREMQDYAVCAQRESHLYRDGEVDRLMKRVEQLSSRLPLQTSYSRVPNENTLGGFEMFSSGVTDLAPELYDWFGEPGAKDGKATRVFLIGSNFSVTGTKVIAGNQVVDHVLLSREVMEITVPAGALSTLVDGEKQIDIHVATPYGVSQHLHIPFEEAEKAPAPAAPPRLTWGIPSQKVIYRWNVTGADPAKTWTVENDAVLVFEPHEIAVKLPDEFRSKVPIPGDATLNLAIYHPTGNGNAALLANSTAGLKYAPDRHAFVMEGASWLALHGELRTKLIGRLKSLGHATSPPDQFTLQITGFITPKESVNPRVEIEGSIQLQAYFQNVGQ